MNDIPSVLAYYHLYYWLHGNVNHVSLDFHLDNVHHNAFETGMDHMLRKGKFEEYVCITFSTLPCPGYSMWNPWKGGWTAESPWNGGMDSMEWGMDSILFPDGFHTLSRWIPYFF